MANVNPIVEIQSDSVTLEANDIFRNHDNIEFAEDDIFIDDDEGGYNDIFSREDVDENGQPISKPNEEFTDNNSLDYELSSTEIKSPGGSRTLFWIPKVDEATEPKEGMIFEKVQHGVDFYIEYSKRAGFDHRLGGSKHSKGVHTHKYVYCSKEGKIDKDGEESLNEQGKRKRKRASKITGCPAYIGLKNIDGGEKFKVYKFVNMHNHALYTKHTVHMSRTRRQLDYFDQHIIHQLSTVNYGASKAHSVVTGLNGGYENQGPKKIDYKNFARDLNTRYKTGDAHSLVQLLELRQKNVPNFTFKYHTKKNKELRALFWADGIAKRNYQEFSDVISFDATFRTNKYNMIYVPFTGIDNHKRCITFGAALLAKETTEYYTWLLKQFLEAFGHQPRVVVTDQDAAMGRAVKTVFTESTHRLCMWHIGRKISDKVSSELIKETDFRKRMQGLIWNSCIAPEVFEERWNALIAEFALKDNKWLNDMFKIRCDWIPAYFKDTPLSGLMRTTSRSESENYFFQSFMSRKTSLLMFICKFDAAMDKQRNIQATSDFDSVSKTPAIQTRVPFEIQAAKFYTIPMFTIFQKELLDAVWSCSPGTVVSTENHESCLVSEQIMRNPKDNKSIFFKPASKEFRTSNGRGFQYQVDVIEKDETFHCNCLLFEHYGILCRHILCVMKKEFMNNIPEKYLVRRWQKDIIRPEELHKSFYKCSKGGGLQGMVQELYSELADCIRLVSHDNEAMAKLVEWQKEIKRKIKENPPEKDRRTKKQLVEAIVGVPIPDEIVIQNPKPVKTKGSGAGGKRIKGKREIAMENAGKEWRTCNFCKKKVKPSEKHDKRNCPVRKEIESTKKSMENEELSEE